MGLLALAATGICSMLGAAIHVVPFMIQRSIPGIGPYVLGAYVFAAIPALLAALAYATLASAMPRAGGSYVYASRALSPYLGFVASFAQWFGLSIAIGVVSYLLVPFLRDLVAAAGLEAAAAVLEVGAVRVLVALGFLWVFVLVNLRGGRLYQRTLVPLMVLAFVLGAVVVVAGFLFDQSDFASALAERGGAAIPVGPVPGFDPRRFLAASALLFSSFIGFDSIAQAGGEARNPHRTLPLAIAIAVVSVGGFYLLFAGAVYHLVPWRYIAQQAQVHDLTAPGLLGIVLAPGWTVAIVGGATVALINDLPAMLLAVSRLMFAWAEDGIFPRGLTRVHPRWHTPSRAILASGCMASAGILGSHLAGDFFLGVDILVTSMLVNFALMCASVIALPYRNPRLARQVSVVSSARWRAVLAGAGLVLLGVFLVVHVQRDLSAPKAAWYLHSTPAWIAVMALASAVYVRETQRLRRAGVDLGARFTHLPPE